MCAQRVEGDGFERVAGWGDEGRGGGSGRRSSAEASGAVRALSPLYVRLRVSAPTSAPCMLHARSMSAPTSALCSLCVRYVSAMGPLQCPLWLPSNAGPHVRRQERRSPGVQCWRKGGAVGLAPRRNGGHAHEL